MRTRLSVMPSACLRSGGTDRWVIAAGRAGQRLGAAEADREMGDLERVEEGEALAPRRPSDRARRSSRRRCSGGGRCRPGARRRRPRGSRDSRRSRPSDDRAGSAQTLAAFSPARVMRSSSVSRLRSSIQAVLGSVIVPIVLRSMRIGVDQLLRAGDAAGDEVANGRRHIWSANRPRDRRRGAAAAARAGRGRCCRSRSAGARRRRTAASRTRGDRLRRRPERWSGWPGFRDR